MSQNLITFTSLLITKHRYRFNWTNAETVVNLNQLSDLFERDKSVISRHLKKIFKETNWIESPTVAFFATVQDEEDIQLQDKLNTLTQMRSYPLDIELIQTRGRISSLGLTDFKRLPC